MANQSRTIVEVTRSGRTVVVEHKEKDEKPGKPDKAGGWHIRMAISYTDNTYHVSMTKSEAHHLAYVLLSYAKTLPKDSTVSENSN